jgi:hypothetical protein
MVYHQKQAIILWLSKQVETKESENFVTLTLTRKNASGGVDWF